MNPKVLATETNPSFSENKKSGLRTVASAKIDNFKTLHPLNLVSVHAKKYLQVEAVLSGTGNQPGCMRFDRGSPQKLALQVSTRVGEEGEPITLPISTPLLDNQAARPTNWIRNNRASSKFVWIYPEQRAREAFALEILNQLNALRSIGASEIAVTDFELEPGQLSLFRNEESTPAPVKRGGTSRGDARELSVIRNEVKELVEMHLLCSYGGYLFLRTPEEEEDNTSVNIGDITKYHDQKRNHNFVEITGAFAVLMAHPEQPSSGWPYPPKERLSKLDAGVSLRGSVAAPNESLRFTGFLTFYDVVEFVLEEPSSTKNIEEDGDEALSSQNFREFMRFQDVTIRALLQKMCKDWKEGTTNDCKPQFAWIPPNGLTTLVDACGEDEENGDEPPRLLERAALFDEEGGVDQLGGISTKRFAVLTQILDEHGGFLYDMGVVDIPQSNPGKNTHWRKFKFFGVHPVEPRVKLSPLRAAHLGL